MQLLRGETMNRIKKVVLYFCLILLGGALFSTLLPACITFRMSKKEVAKKFKSAPYSPIDIHYTVGLRAMHAVLVGDTSLPLVVFIHGSPGSWGDFADFMRNTELLQKVCMISVDRAGFGYSGFGIPEVSLQQQAANVAPLLEKYGNNKPTILIGHSYGGPVVAQFAMDFPNLTSGVIFLAPSLDPALEPLKWYQIPAHWPVIKQIIPRIAMVSNEEILALKGCLETILPRYSSLKMPVIMVQGMKDMLVDPGNADFVKKMISNAPLEMIIEPEMNHFIPWSHPHLVTSSILKMLGKINADNNK